MTRDLDVVLVGATGFTGTLAAEHLARAAPTDLRWALAGRNRAKLEAVREALPAGVAPAEIVVVASDDDAALRSLAERSRVVIGAVGPYLQHGDPLVAACAAAGTDYVDLTGEPEFVDRTYLRHHATAVASGARLVHACGFDSVPHDLGALFTVRQLVDVDGPVRLRGVVRAGGGVSGGTFASLLGAASRVREMRAAARERAAAEPAPSDGRRARQVTLRPGRDPLLGLWLLPLPAIDQAIIARSAAALPDFGPDLSYSHAAGLRRAPVLVGALGGIAATVAVAQVGPARRLLMRRLPQGTGPSAEVRAASGFTVDLVAETDAGPWVHCRVTGMDPYDLSGIALAESALSLALDDNPPTAGQVTTAQAMGDALTARMERVGVRFEVVARG
ncbi:saccharopine dehydrogenase NADP-binding domain-containing protein [Nocardioides fonticola]|uniref:Saccharopine dehydrogenase NADP-binding domain-containing protein n=1 Tax=Nocardioides fonticola TaxID=450363 RepID=A0ABP7XQM5_9ACTN